MCSGVHTRAFLHTNTHTYTHTRSAWDRGSARTEGGKSDSCGCEHSAAYRTSTHTHAHTRFGIIYCAREIINVHIIYCVFLSFFMCSSLMILFMLIYFFYGFNFSCRQFSFGPANRQNTINKTELCCTALYLRTAGRCGSSDIWVSTA